MKSFMRGVLGSATGSHSSASKAMRVTAVPQPLHYTLSAFRWHMDSRPPSKVIAIHDYLSSSAAWEQRLNETLADLPLSRLTPNEPLEVYSVDLRGHNLSEKIGLGEGEELLGASAADVALLQRDILEKEAKLTGVGFGAMVAAHAALHSPDSYSAMILFVKNFNQLFQCNPEEHAVRDLLMSAPAGAKTIAELNEYLKAKLPNSSERAELLSTVQEEGVQQGARFRFDKKLVASDAVITTLPDADDAVFDKPVTVFVADAKEQPPSPEDVARFKKWFPQTRVMGFNAPGASMGSKEAPLVPIMLHHFELLGEVNTE